MLGFVSRLVGERRSVPDEPDVVDDRGEKDEREGRPPTRLYECPDCESVYLSDDQSTCRSCDTSVEAIPSERDLGFGSGGAEQP